MRCCILCQLNKPKICKCTPYPILILDNIINTLSTYKAMSINDFRYVDNKRYIPTCYMLGMYVDMCSQYDHELI